MVWRMVSVTKCDSVEPKLVRVLDLPMVWQESRDTVLESPWWPIGTECVCGKVFLVIG